MKFLCLLRLHKWHYSHDGKHRFCERCGEVQEAISDAVDYDEFYLRGPGRHGGWG